MKVGDKYIIEIEEVIKRYGAPHIARIKGFNALVFDQYGLEKLKPYDGEDAYDKGLNEAWEVAKWLYNNPVDIAEDIFNCDYLEIYNKYTVQEVAHKIKEYEEQQKQDAEIKVGDEIVSGDAYVVVTYISPEGEWNGFTLNKTKYGEKGQGYTCMRNFNFWQKTGRHYPQIAEVLAEANNDKDTSERDDDTEEDD